MMLQNLHGSTQNTKKQIEHTTTDKNLIFMPIKQLMAVTGKYASAGIALTATQKVHSVHIQRYICGTQGLQCVLVDQQKDYL
jgi:hypothetical protein